ncbi:hypothetical protein [Streptomyces sp. NPDC053048]|uniref:hypothetical protein n=1 Tax=Streptomyces sp. NPDC053048 TaxID=3365694 RepID=UPI0037CD3914
MDDKAESEAKTKGRRLDLSVAQVAGSALAAVVAALLAGKLGVYGTVIGAGVVSVVATTGGTVFQHVFKRTGEQIREAATVQPEPRLRRVPVDRAGRAVDRARSAEAATGELPAATDRTQLMPQASLPGADPARSEAHAGAYTGAHDETYFHGYSEEFNGGTTHGTRLRGWKRPALAAAAVFALAMGTVTAWELVSGSSADGGDGVTVTRLFQPEKKDHHKPDPGPERTPDPGHSRGGEDAGEGESTPSPGVSRPGGDTGKQTPDPSGSPSPGGSTPSPNPTPKPSPSPDAGKGTDDKGGAAGGAAGTTGGQSAPPQGQNAAAGTGTGTGSTPGTAS